ncbi:MAG TPA: hypothetical protein HPP81_01300 [Deltaproteobacteria bacterium]|nr:hypothetical protein [Deltaproteobacteria bacterium]
MEHPAETIAYWYCLECDRAGRGLYTQVFEQDRLEPCADRTDVWFSMG